MGLRGNDAENNEPRATGSRLLERQPGVTVSDQLGLVGFRAGVSCCPGRADVLGGNSVAVCIVSTRANAGGVYTLLGSEKSCKLGRRKLRRAKNTRELPAMIAMPSVLGCAARWLRGRETRKGK